MCYIVSCGKTLTEWGWRAKLYRTLVHTGIAKRPDVTMVTPICGHCKKLLASGIFEITTKRGFVSAMCLCAACGMSTVANRVRAFDNGDELVFYRDVATVKLIHTFTRPNEPDKPGGLKPGVSNVTVAPLSPGVIAAAEYRAGLNRPQSRIHPSVLNRVDWSYR